MCTTRKNKKVSFPPFQGLRERANRVERERAALENKLKSLQRSSSAKEERAAAALREARKEAEAAAAEADRLRQQSYSRG